MLACFVLDPRLEASSGRRRLQFLGDALRQLRSDLNGRLLVTRGQPEKLMPRIANEIGASSVHISEDFEFSNEATNKSYARIFDEPLIPLEDASQA